MNPTILCAFPITIIGLYTVVIIDKDGIRDQQIYIKDTLCFDKKTILFTNRMLTYKM